MAHLRTNNKSSVSGATRVKERAAGGSANGVPGNQMAESLVDHAADFLSRAHTPGLWVVLGGCEHCTLTPITEAKGLDSSSSSYSSTVGNPAGQLSSETLEFTRFSHQALTGVFPPKGSSCGFHFPSPRCQGYCLSSSLPWHPCLSRSSHSILSLLQ